MAAAARATASLHHQQHPVLLSSSSSSSSFRLQTQIDSNNKIGCTPLILNHLTCNSNYKPSPKITATANAIPPDYVADSKFYKVEAIIRPWRLQKVSSALLKLGIRGVTVSDVRGFGAQGGSAERHAGSEFSEDSFISKVKMEIVVSKDQVDPVVDLIIQEARTGEIGDGKIFVLPVADVIRVRTGERAEEAQKMSGDWREV